jgi:hypothetical protein
LKATVRLKTAARAAVLDADPEMRSQGLQALAKVDSAAAMGFDQ